jgi:capsular polysaccharide biosynthesis protein
MTDQATVLSWLVRIGQLPSRRLIVTRRAWTGLADVMRQTVEAILPDAELIEHPDGEVWQFDSLAYAMPLHVPPSFKLPAALDSLRAHLLAVATPTGKGPRRLHVLRGADASRRLDNEAELLEISAAHDFVPVQPERLSLAEQVSLFAGAEAVIGVKGAALTAILFAASSCPLIVLSPASFVDLGHWNIASLRGQPYWELYGPVTSRGGDPSYRNFRIDPAKFETLLQRALGKRPRRWWRWRS